MVYVGLTRWKENGIFIRAEQLGGEKMTKRTEERRNKHSRRKE
jgi:hypothetical protein